MAPRQVTDEEYNFLQGRRQVADFVESIYNDPQLTREAKALIKKKYPNLQIADYDIEQKVEARFAKDAEERRTKEDNERKAREDTAFKEKRGDTQKRYGFTDDAMKRLETMMVERNIGDYEVAAEYMASREPKPSGADDYDSTRWHHERADNFAEISKDPEAWGRTQLLNAIRADQQRERTGR